jgi:hypothetical protein
MGCLGLHRHTVDLNRLMAPIKLEGFGGVKGQRDEDLGSHMLLLPTPALYISPHAVIAAAIPLVLQLLKKHLRASPSFLWQLLILF